MAGKMEGLGEAACKCIAGSYNRCLVFNVCFESAYQRGCRDGAMAGMLEPSMHEEEAPTAQ